MKVFGDIEGLKKEISNTFELQVKETEEETEKQVKALNSEAEKKAEAIMEQAKTDCEALAREAKQRVLNEEKLKAKKNFEESRERLIMKVIEEAKNEISKKAKSKEYLDFLKANKPNENAVQTLGSEASYKAIFPQMKADKNLRGVKVITSDAVYDLTLDNLLQVNEELVRRTITQNIFRE